MVLEEKHKKLRAMAFGNLRAPKKFWQKLEDQEKAKGSVPVTARKTLEELMPEPGLHYRLVARESGLGSLGRYRVVAIANWRGGKVAREAKALAPSACLWALGRTISNTIPYRSILNQAVRCLDPFVFVNESWIGRRLSLTATGFRSKTCPRSETSGSPIFYGVGNRQCTSGHKKSV